MNVVGTAISLIFSIIIFIVIAVGVTWAIRMALRAVGESGTSGGAQMNLPEKMPQAPKQRQYTHARQEKLEHGYVILNGKKRRISDCKDL